MVIGEKGKEPYMKLCTYYIQVQDTKNTDLDLDG